MTRDRQEELLGAHFETTGADAKGPPLLVCDACRCDVRWTPGLCPTPWVHVDRRRRA